jgi:hypothetical protein
MPPSSHRSGAQTVPQAGGHDGDRERVPGDELVVALDVCHLLVAPVRELERGERPGLGRFPSFVSEA